MDKSFEIQRIYVRKMSGAGFGKEMFTFALDQARVVAWVEAWLGVWERNFKAQGFTTALVWTFSEHQYITGDTVDTDWLLRKHLKDIRNSTGFKLREGWGRSAWSGILWSEIC